MKAKTTWRYLDDKLLIDLPNTGERNIEPGCNSKEKIIQIRREQLTLPVIYSTNNMIPNSPEEPDQTKVIPYTEPLNIPLDDFLSGIELTYDSWPKSMSDRQSPITEFPIDIDNEKSMVDMASQQQLSVHNGNEISGLNVDNMKAKTTWRYLDDFLLIDIPDTDKSKIVPECNSKEKIIQTLRERITLPAIYSNKNMIPNSPDEPDQTETVPYSEPLSIPLEDMTQISNMNNITPMHNIMQQPTATNSVNDGYEMYNSRNNIQFENMMRVPAPKNNVYAPFNGMMNDQSIQQLWFNQMPQQQSLPYYFPHTEEITPFQYIPEILMQPYQNWALQKPPSSNRPSNVWPPRQHNQPWVSRNVRSSNYHGHITEDHSRGHSWNEIYYHNQHYNRRESDYRSHHAGNRRMNGRLCRNLKKKGICRNMYCTFLH